MRKENLILLLGTFIMSLNSCHKEKVKERIVSRTKIDSIVSVEQLSKFVTSIDTNYRYVQYDSIIDFKSRFSSMNCPVLADSAQITKTFLKADFDDNGYNDLVVISRYKNFEINLFTILGFKGSFKIKPLSHGVMEECRYPQLTTIDSLPGLNIFSYDRNGIREYKIKKTKLIYKYGDFIEYNPNPKKHQIQKIHIEVSPCFGKCPYFTLDINDDRTANLNAIGYNYKNYPNDLEEKKGKYKTIIQKQNFDQLITLLNYIDFENLKDNYSVYHTDDASIDIKIIYDNGKEKQIHDYGEIGTYGLVRIYDIIKELRFNQDWTN